MISVRQVRGEEGEAGPHHCGGRGGGAWREPLDGGTPPTRLMLRGCCHQFQVNANIQVIQHGFTGPLWAILNRGVSIIYGHSLFL